MKFRKLCALLLAVLMLLGVFVGCGGTAPTEASTEAVVTDDPNLLYFARNGEGNCFTVVRAENAEDVAVKAAVRLCGEIETAVGTRPDITEDYLMPGTAPAENEILIGATNREQSSLCPEELGTNDFFVGVLGGKICIIGGTDGAVASGINYFISTYVAGNEVCAVPKDLAYTYRSVINTYAIGDVLDSLKILGRHSMDGKGLCCDLSACGIEFCAECEGEVSIKIQAVSSDVYFSVFVDGERLRDRIFVEGGKTQTVVACQGLPMEEHTIRIIKDNESRQPATLRELSFAGEFLDAPEENEIYLEFMGDSITCGYGLSNPKNDSDSSHFWASRAYSYICADALEADYSMVSISGYAITGTGSIPSILWPYTSWKRSPKPKYDFARKPTALIINLGTNESGSSSRAVSKSVFETGVRNFIPQARQSYNDPNLPIIFVYDMMRDGYQDAILKVVNELGGADANLYTYKGVRNNGGYGAHPDSGAQKKTGEGLAAFIQENILK